MCLQYFDTVGWVLRPVKNRRPYNLYCVGGDVKPCSINQSTQPRGGASNAPVFIQLSRSNYSPYYTWWDDLSRPDESILGVD